MRDEGAVLMTVGRCVSDAVARAPGSDGREARDRGGRIVGILYMKVSGDWVTDSCVLQNPPRPW